MPRSTHPASRHDTGAGVVEYVLLITAIALVVVFSMTVFGDRLAGSFSDIAAAIGGDGTGSGGGEDTPGGPGEPGSGIAWDPDAIYEEGDTVEHDGRTWEAGWWTQNQRPGDTNTGPWQEMATAPDGTAVWTSSRIFDTGDVIHDGVRYRAKWWTRNQPVDTPDGPWERID